MNISNMINKKIDENISNKKQETIKYYIRICLTLLIISAVTAALLALVNAVTKDRIAQNELAVMEEALGRIFVGCDNIEAVEGEFGEPVTAVYKVYSGGKLLGYGIQSSPVGFKDVIGLIVGTDVGGSCLGVEITSISDTPGVGTKVKDGGFLAGFKGLNGKNVTEYDTISGATISSKAVKSGVEAALSLGIFGDVPVVPAETPGSETTAGNGEENVEETTDEAVAETVEETAEETVADTGAAESSPENAG